MELTELSDPDKSAAEADAAIRAHEIAIGITKRSDPITPRERRAYRAGLAAGIERAAVRCDELAKQYGIFADGRPAEVCAQYVRDLIKP